MESKQSPAGQHKEQLLGYRLDIRKNSFSERVVRLPREMVGSSVLECSKNVYMWCLRKWLSGGLGRIRLRVGLDDLRGLLQPKGFYDSIY